LDTSGRILRKNQEKVVMNYGKGLKVGAAEGPQGPSKNKRMGSKKKEKRCRPYIIRGGGDLHHSQARHPTGEPGEFFRAGDPEGKRAGGSYSGGVNGEEGVPDGRSGTL